MDFLPWLSDPSAWIALLTLTILEIVLGIDNIIFISILSSKLPQEEQGRARTLGLFLAMFTRILLLFSIAFIVRSTETLFSVGFINQLAQWGGGGLAGGHGGVAPASPGDISLRDLILFAGGMFLIYKSTKEIHAKLEGEEEHTGNVKEGITFRGVIIQILLLDVVFSLDSVITAVGMAEQISVMVLAVIIAVGIMMVAAGPVSNYVESHPTVKMLALSFLLLIGVTLIADALAVHIPKGYVYFAMGFSVFVEMLNLTFKRRNPVTLRGPHEIGVGTPEEAVAHASGE